MTSLLKSVAKLKRRPPESWPPTVAAGKIAPETEVIIAHMFELKPGDVVLNNDAVNPVELYRVEHASVTVNEKGDNMVEITVIVLSEPGQPRRTVRLRGLSAVRVRRATS